MFLWQLIGNPDFCLTFYLTGVHFRGEFSTLVTSVSKNSSMDQSELEIWVVSDCQKDCMQEMDAGLWMLDARLWTVDPGLWMRNSGRWNLDVGLCLLDSGRCTQDSGRCTLDTGIWTPDAVIACFRTKSEFSSWFCLIKLLKILWVWISIRTSWSPLFCRDHRF